jgi:hypothetical protein
MVKGTVGACSWGRQLRLPFFNSTVVDGDSAIIWVKGIRGPEICRVWGPK